MPSGWHKFKNWFTDEDHNGRSAKGWAEDGTKGATEKIKEIQQKIDSGFNKLGNKIGGTVNEGFKRMGQDMKRGFKPLADEMQRIEDSAAQNVGYIKHAFQKSERAMHKAYSAVGNELHRIGDAFTGFGDIIKDGFYDIIDMLKAIFEQFKALFGFFHLMVSLGVRTALLSIFLTPLFAGLAVLATISQMLSITLAVPEEYKKPIEVTAAAAIAAFEAYIYFELGFWKLRPGGKQWEAALKLVRESSHFGAFGLVGRALDL